jgi:hypothetical protein
LTLALVGGCKGKPTDHSSPDDPAAPATGAPTPAPAPAVADNQPTVAVPEAPPLPPAGPPLKTTAKFGFPDYDKLSKLAWPGYHAGIHQNDALGLQVKHLTETRPKMAVLVLVSQCTTCVPMDLAQWLPLKDKMRGAIPAIVRDQPDTSYEMGEVTVDGLKMINTYALGLHWTGEQVGNNIGGFVNAYTLYYNDGINAIRVVASYGDDGVATKEQLTKVLTREKLAKAAADFMAQYLAVW